MNSHQILKDLTKAHIIFAISNRLGKRDLVSPIKIRKPTKLGNIFINPLSAFTDGDDPLIPTGLVIAIIIGIIAFIINKIRSLFADPENKEKNKALEPDEIIRKNIEAIEIREKLWCAYMNSNVFHPGTCHYVQYDLSHSPEKMEWFNTELDARASGRTHCKCLEKEKNANC